MNSFLKIIFLFYMLIAFASNDLIAQQNEELIPKEMITKVVQFRDHMLRQDEETLYALRDLLLKWDEVGLTREQKINVASMVVAGASVEGLRDKYVSRKMNKWLPEDGYNLQISEKEVVLIKNNYEILELINMGVLKNKFPFVIAKDFTLLQEIVSYNIMGEERIAEIGAGSGFFALFLKYLYCDIQIYLNELDLAKSSSMRILADKHSNFINTENCYFQKGKKKSTELEEHLFDKIIIRNTYHHFSKDVEMLNSIKKSMHSKSRLYLLEEYSDKHKTEGSCKQTLSRKKILSTLSANGFLLINETEFEHEALLEFTLAEE